LRSTRLGDTDCLILDLRLPGISGLDLQRTLSLANQAIPIVFISAHADDCVRMEGLRAGAVDFLDKPFSEKALLSALDSALKR